MNRLYILRDRMALPCFDMVEWSRAFESTERTVARSENDDWTVSTVFLGIDHRFGPGEPLVFETMVFLADGDYGMMERYPTWAAAAAGHERIRSMVEREHADAGAATLAALRAACAAPVGHGQ